MVSVSCHRRQLGKGLVWGLVLLLALGAAGAGWLWQAYRGFLEAPLAMPDASVLPAPSRPSQTTLCVPGSSVEPLLSVRTTRPAMS
mgnify:CR=1 FL=1